MGDAATMVSKRSTRAYVESLVHGEENTPHRSRRNSRHEESIPDTVESVQAVIAREQTAPVEATLDISIKHVARPEVTDGKGENCSPTLPISPADVRLIPIEGRPINFGVVVPGVYRSSYPKPADYGFIQDLGLKTIVTLVQTNELDATYTSFIAANGIRHHIFNMKGTKKEDIPIKTMKSILRLVLDQQHHPLLIHCNHGKHRTGCVVAVIRKVTGWELPTIIEEYKSYAGTKVRDCDIRYISAFEIANLSNLWTREADYSMRIQTFLRATMFSSLVLAVWIFSTIRITMRSPPMTQKHQ